MRRCWLVLGLTLYLSLDVANPLMPGAVTFGSENSLELRQAERFRGDHDAVAPAPSFDRIDAARDDTATTVLLPLAPGPTAFPRARRPRSSLFAASAPSEDPLTLRP
jgi:hypothetical protein